MKVAAFNGFNCHYEMFGYVIHYCLTRNHEITVYFNDLSNNEGYLEWYKKAFNSKFSIKNAGEFEQDRCEYDRIFLLTDDDDHFNTDNPEINRRTICIDHYYRIRRSVFERRIATRPFDEEWIRPYAIPLYPIITASQKKSILDSKTDPGEINILILGHARKYNENVLSRIRPASNDREYKIIFHAATRNPGESHFPRIENFRVYPNLDAAQMFDLAFHCDYMIGTDLCDLTRHIRFSMSGGVPFAFSTMTPLLICKQANEYYQFRNVVEYEKNTTEDIVLRPIDLNDLELERNSMIVANQSLFDYNLRENPKKRFEEEDSNAMLIDLLKVHKFDNKIRLGTRSQGGYVIADLPGGYDFYISAGVSLEESFSREFTEKYGMDEFNSMAFHGNMASYPPDFPCNVAFIRKAIGAKNGPSTTNLVSILEIHDKVFLKMAIEGGEYAWLAAMDEKRMKRIKQMVIQFHGLVDDEWGCPLEQKIECISNITKTHFLIHAHGNSRWSTTFGMPNVIELTFVNKDLFKTEPPQNDTRLPTPNLDFSNDQTKDDIDLNWYPFVKNEDCRSKYFVNLYFNEEIRTAIRELATKQHLKLNEILRTIFSNSSIDCMLVWTVALETKKIMKQPQS